MASGTIVLSGFMATGKSTVGRRLAARLSVPFVDTDDLIAADAGQSVPDLWRAEGEAAFRAREAALIGALLGDGVRRVVALGGGSATIRALRHSALEAAFVVTLTADPATIVGRVADLAGRPNLAIGDPRARAAELLAQRSEAYAEAHLTIATDGLDPDAIVDVVVAASERAPLAMPLGGRSYTIDVARDAPALLTDAIARLMPSSLVVVTDSNVHRCRGAALTKALAPLAASATWVTLAPGEEHKTLAAIGTIWDAALGVGVDRDALVVAFGGGVVGDLAGFAASSLLRGVRFVQVPTTLLSMVDSSVGGKTGFDHAAGKNLLGAFHQPSGVVIDVEHLTTLPARDRTSGLAEIVKIALACDAPLLAALEAHAPALRAGDPEALAPIIRAAVAAKIRIVRDDEREAGARALLNLGHTIGHALEAHGGYAKHRHGEAVAIGTVLELEATAAMGLTPPGVRDRARTLLAALGLPVAVPHAELVGAWPYIAADKKRTRDAIRLPIVTAPGVAHVARVALTELRARALSAT